MDAARGWVCGGAVLVREHVEQADAALLGVLLLQLLFRCCRMSLDPSGHRARLYGRRWIVIWHSLTHTSFYGDLCRRRRVVVRHGLTHEHGWRTTFASHELAITQQLQPRPSRTREHWPTR